MLSSPEHRSCLQVVDDKGQTSVEGGNNDLLNAFNVATFKGEDDDAAFWDRLIPAGARTAPEAETPELGLRSTRLRGLDDVRSCSVLRLCICT